MDQNELAIAASKSKTARATRRGDNEGDKKYLRTLLQALQAARSGDFSARLPTDQVDLAGKIADAFNDVVSANERMARQLEQVGQIVGREGKTRKRLRLGLSAGAWGEMESSVNALIDDLLWPTAAVTHAVTAVAQGDLQQTVPLDVDGRPLQGEFLRSAKIVNAMIKQLSVFTSESSVGCRHWSGDGRGNLGSRFGAVLLHQAHGLWSGAFDGSRAHAPVWRSNAHCEPAERGNISFVMAPGRARGPGFDGTGS
jgi:hypothetical protein